MPASTELQQAPWDLPALSHLTHAVWPGMQVQWLASIDSTNTELMRRAAQRQYQPCVLLAQEQTAGKGRMGKSWYMQAGKTLALSIGLPLQPRDWSGLSLVVGVALLSALTQWARSVGAAPERQHALTLGLKWPNDVWLMAPDGQGQKMAGILIETLGISVAEQTASQRTQPVPMAAAPRYAVIGIGLNLSPQELQSTAMPLANVQDWAGVPVPAQQLLEHVLASVLAAIQQFEREGFTAFHSAFEAWDLLAGRTVSLSDGRVGDCLGVDGQGELLLSVAGALVPVASGEVSVRPVAPAARLDQHSAPRGV